VLTHRAGPVCRAPSHCLAGSADFLQYFDRPDDASLSVGRAVDESTFIAGIRAAEMDVGGPLVELGAQTVAVTSSFDQGHGSGLQVLMMPRSSSVVRSRL